MTWWCSAGSTAWTWQWQAYPGVWLFIALLVAVYARFAAPGVTERGRRGWFLAGILTLWVALDWPVGALGAGYLASVHMLQYLLIALVAPPLLLLGLPPSAWVRARATTRFLHPLATLVIFSVVVYATHLPRVVDGLMITQAGSFLIDVLWLGAGLAFWWPVIAPSDPSRPFPPPLKMGYLFLSTVVNTLPYAFLTFGDLPFYGVYELAPPVAGLTARQDQQIAGLLMKGGGGAVLWTAITILFFRWARREELSDTAPVVGSMKREH